MYRAILSHFKAHKWWLIQCHGTFPVTHPAPLGGRHEKGQRIGGPAPPVSHPWEGRTKTEYVTLQTLPTPIVGFAYKHHVGCLRNKEIDYVVGTET